MKQPIHIIYISGFGDDFDKWRLRFLRLWHYRDVSVELVPMKWDSGTFAQKMARIDRAVDRAKDRRTVIVGESAGGSMAVHMYARRADDLHKVMTLCGKNTHPESVSPHLFKRSPAFKTSMDLLDESLAQLSSKQKSEFVSIHPIYDNVVPVNETLLPGCKQVRLWAWGHVTVIMLALTVLSPILIRAARK